MSTYKSGNIDITNTSRTEDFSTLKKILDRKKGLVCNEFEKVCPTEKSLGRMVKEMHDIFDSIEEELKQTYKI
jgi:hypothetical protein